MDLNRDINILGCWYIFYVMINCACSHSGVMDDILTICPQCGYTLNWNFDGEDGG